MSLRRVGEPLHRACARSTTRRRRRSASTASRGFFHCFGCGVGGNVFKFVELQERVSFPEAVRLVAQKFGVAAAGGAGCDARSRPPTPSARALLTMHEVAAEFYRDVLASARPAAAAASCWSGAGWHPRRSTRLGFGFAPPGRDALLSHLRRKGVPPALAVKSGLVVDRDGRLFDRFWNRLMIPICREGGSIVAFGGRAMEADQQPEVPEQPRDADLLEGAHALRAERDQGRHPQGRATRCWSRAISISRRRGRAA